MSLVQLRASCGKETRFVEKFQHDGFRLPERLGHRSGRLLCCSRRRRELRSWPQRSARQAGRACWPVDRRHAGRHCSAVVAGTRGRAGHAAVAAFGPPAFAVVGLPLLGLLEAFGIWMFIAGRRLRRGVPGAIDRAGAAAGSALPPPGLWQPAPGRRGGLRGATCPPGRQAPLLPEPAHLPAGRPRPAVQRRELVSTGCASGCASPTSSSPAMPPIDAALYVRGTVGPGAAMALRKQQGPAGPAAAAGTGLSRSACRPGLGGGGMAPFRSGPARRVDRKPPAPRWCNWPVASKARAPPRAAGASTRPDPLARVHVALWLAVVGIGLLSFLVPLYRPLRWTLAAAARVVARTAGVAGLRLARRMAAAWHSRSHDRWLWLCGATACW